MSAKRLIRTLITVCLVVALITIIIVSQNYDSANPHGTVDKETWIYGSKGHGYAVLNNQQPWTQCYPCHVKQGLGGEESCLSCHAESGVKIDLPQPTPSK